MTEPQITHSEPTTLRAAAEAVIHQHRTQGEYLDFENGGIHQQRCYGCFQDWPCDAHRMASALLDLTEALEWYADVDTWLWKPDTSPPDALRDIGDKATAALAAAAARLEAT